MGVVHLKYKGILTIKECASVSVIILTDLEERRQISVLCDGYTRLQFAVRTQQIDPSQIRFQMDELYDDEDDGFDAGEGRMDGSDNLVDGRKTADSQSKRQTFKERMLPEVLCSIIHYMTDMQLGVSIVNIYDGQYRAVIVDKTSGTTFPISVTEGILLTIANRHVPLFIDERIWRMQSMPYSNDIQGMALPINTLTMPMLRNALQNAIDDERYEAAQALKEEIQRREM